MKLLDRIFRRDECAVCKRKRPVYRGIRNYRNVRVVFCRECYNNIRDGIISRIYDNPLPVDTPDLCSLVNRLERGLKGGDK
jgi:hypothetical protein